MKNRKKEIAGFIESMNLEELNSGSILLGMGEASVAASSNVECDNSTINCAGSVNTAECHNRKSMCFGSSNSGVCKDIGTSELIPNIDCR